MAAKHSIGMQNMANYTSIKVDQDRSDMAGIMKSVIACAEINLLVEAQPDRQVTSNQNEPPKPAKRSASTSIRPKISSPELKGRRTSMIQRLKEAKRNSGHHIQVKLANALKYLSPSPSKSGSKKQSSKQINLQISETERIIELSPMATEENGKQGSKVSQSRKWADPDSSEELADADIQLQAELLEFSKSTREAILAKCNSFDSRVSEGEMQRELAGFLEDLLRSKQRPPLLAATAAVGVCHEANAMLSSPPPLPSHNHQLHAHTPDAWGQGMSDLQRDLLMQKIVRSALKSFRSHSRAASELSKKMESKYIKRESQPPKSRFSRRVLIELPSNLAESPVLKKWRDEDVNAGRGLVGGMNSKIPECLVKISDRLVAYLCLFTQQWGLEHAHDKEKLMMWLSSKLEKVADSARLVVDVESQSCIQFNHEVVKVILGGPRQKPNYHILYYNVHIPLWKTHQKEQTESGQPFRIHHNQLCELFLNWAKKGLLCCFSAFDQTYIQKAVNYCAGKDPKTPYKSQFLVSLLTHIFAPAGLPNFDAGLYIHVSLLQESLLKLYSLLLACNLLCKIRPDLQFVTATNVLRYITINISFG
jgi:hypothetical protein